METLVEAAAQILEAGDVARFTTNRVAERAGYSIGTLYNYFPNKQALLRALVEREIRRQEARLQRLLAAEPALPTETLVRRMLRSALRPFEQRRGLQRAMLGLLLTERDIVVSAAEVGARLLHELTERTGYAGGADADRIARDATLGAIIGAATLLGQRDPALLQTQAVEDELVRLLLHGLRAR